MQRFGKLTNTECFSVSSGTIAAYYILDQKEFSEYQKYMLGFSFQGWRGHEWDLEKKFIGSFVECGKLIELE
jgi:hypothetical protein